MDAVQLDRFRVTITMPVSKVRWSWLTQLTSINTLTAQADWYSMRDLPIAVASDIPLQ